MDVTLYTNTALFDDLRDEWNPLIQDSSADRIFLTYQWQSSWWEAYHPGTIWTLVVRDGDELVGLAPWFLRAESGGRRVARTIGCVDVTDYLEVVARHGREREVFEALAAFLAEHEGEWDDIRLCNVPEASLTVQMLPEVFRADGFEVEVTLQEVCPVVYLPDDFNEFIAGLDKKDRHELRRKIRRSGAANIELYIVGPEHDLDAEMQTFLRLMAASSDEKALFLREQENMDFFNLVVPKLAEAGWLRLTFLTVDGKPAAAYLNFDYAGCIMVYNSGLDAETYGHLSPGIILIARIIEQAIKEGRDEVDFLRGDESYKYQLGAQDTNVYQVALNRPREA